VTDETDEECLARLKTEAVEKNGWVIFHRRLHLQELRVWTAYVAPTKDRSTVLPWYTA